MSAPTTNPEHVASSTDDVSAPPLSPQARAIIILRALNMQGDQLQRVYGSETVQEVSFLARLSMQASMAAEDPSAVYDALSDTALNTPPTTIFYDETGADDDPTICPMNDAQELIADRPLFAEAQPTLPGAYSEVVSLALLFQAQDPTPEALRLEAQDLLNAATMPNRQAAA